MKKLFEIIVKISAQSFLSWDLPVLVTGSSPNFFHSISAQYKLYKLVNEKRIAHHTAQKCSLNCWIFFINYLF